MAIVRTTSVALLNKNLQPVADINIQPKPLGTSETHFLMPAFRIDPASTPAVIIELKLSIVNTDRFQFGVSQAISKTYLIPSNNVKPIGFSLNSLVDFTNFPFANMRFETRVHKDPNDKNFLKFIEQFTTRY